MPVRLGGHPGVVAGTRMWSRDPSQTVGSWPDSISKRRPPMNVMSCLIVKFYYCRRSECLNNTGGQQPKQQRALLAAGSHRIYGRGRSKHPNRGMATENTIEAATRVGGLPTPEVFTP